METHANTQNDLFTSIPPLAFLVSIIFLINFYPIAAHAQISINTIGATDAKTCAENAFMASQELSACNKALRNRLTTKTDRIKTFINRGIIYNNRLDIDNALEDFNEALTTQHYNGEAYANRGNSYFLIQDYALALADYQQALDEEVRKPWAVWYNIGLTYQYQNKEMNAQDAFHKALSLNPDFGPAQNKMQSSLQSEAP